MELPLTPVFLQFGGAFCGSPEGPFRTVLADARTVPATPRPTRSGYGRRIPTDLMVWFNHRWRRVYACHLGNWPTLYIGPSTKPIATVTT